MAKLRIGIVLILSVVAVLGAFYYYAVSSPYKLSIEEARRRIKTKEVDVVLDVRTALERQTLGSYPGSVHIPGAELEREIQNKYPNKATRFLVYCNTGQRARAATEKLQALGYTNTRYIATSYRYLMD